MQPTRSPPLSRDQIAAAALELVDRNGLATLTARRLAQELGCEAMSLYHHFARMDDLLDTVAERLLAGIELPAPPAGGELRANLRALANRYLALAAAHPHAFPLVATRRLRRPGLALVDRLGGLLAAHGISGRRALRTLRVLAAYLNGAGLALAAWRLDPHPTAPPPAQPGGAGLSALRDALDATSVSADLAAGAEQLIAALCAPQAL
jgi:AcrR family transcriptional regulator